MSPRLKYPLIGILVAVVLVVVFVVQLSNAINNVKSDDPTVWENDIQAFEKYDNKFPPSSDSILFVGSSSIRFWKTLAEDMHPLPVLNRGFGGAKINDVSYYAPRIVLPYRPDIIVFYAGDNDMSVGRIQTSDEVLNNYKQFISLVHEALPDTKIYFISIKPSIARWEFWPEMSKANDLIREFANKNPMLGFIDVSAQMLQDGEPREDIIGFDGIHMNSKGYEIWADLIKPLLHDSMMKR